MWVRFLCWVGLEPAEPRVWAFTVALPFMDGYLAVQLASAGTAGADAVTEALHGALFVILTRLS